MSAADLALFDLDNTLLAGDSDYEWGQFLIDRGVLDRDAYEVRNTAFFEQYKAGTLDIHAYLQFALEPLARHTPEDLARWHADFMDTRIRPMIGPQAQALVRRHLDAGDLCAVVTATNSFVTAPIAREFGIPHLIATEPERAGDRFTGRVAGTPCFKEGKITRVQDWLAGLGRPLEDFSLSTFYSDSQNDLPLLSLVKQPVAVDPDEKLAAEAARRGWPVISLR
ncbi:MAG: HAD family hydrolase [Betaproteobacteria bacterium]